MWCPRWRQLGERMMIFTEKDQELRVEEVEISNLGLGFLFSFLLSHLFIGTQGLNLYLE